LTWYTIEHNRDAEATIDLFGGIGEPGGMAADFIRELDGIKSKRIRMRLNSPGGSVEDGIAIYNALRAHPAEVEAHVLAAAHSIASVILQAADRRIMAPHSRVMVHNAMGAGGGFTVGYADDFDEVAAEYVKLAVRLRETSAEIASIYAERTGKEAAYWLAKMAGETRFGAESTVAEGLADEVGETFDAKNFQIAANFDWAGYKDADAIRAELLEAAGEEGKPAAGDSHPDGLTELTARVEALEQLMLPKPNGHPPLDAARRELEEALARVQL